jgi:hypothetical protein
MRVRFGKHNQSWPVRFGVICRREVEMRSVLYGRVVAHVNRKLWWHVPPVDPDAYKKRGKFLASSFGEAEFWGRPLDEPQTVAVATPLVGDEPTIERKLFGKVVCTSELTVRQRFSLDAKMKRAALAKGYDSILLMGRGSFVRLKATGKIPRSLELNILCVG